MVLDRMVQVSTILDMEMKSTDYLASDMHGEYGDIVDERNAQRARPFKYRTDCV